MDSLDTIENQSIRLSIIVPVFNEVQTLEFVLVKLENLGLDGVEVIVVDDGSTDGSTKIIQKFTKKPNFKAIFHKQNIGKGAAVTTAASQATGSYIVIQDADLEYNPAQLVELLQLAESRNAQAVYGTRFDRGRPKNMTLKFWLGNMLLNRLVKLFFGGKLNDVESCYKMINRQIFNELNIKSKGFDFEIEVSCKLILRNATIEQFPVAYVARSSGKKISAIRDGSKSLLRLLLLRLGLGNRS